MTTAAETAGDTTDPLARPPGRELPLEPAPHAAPSVTGRAGAWLRRQLRAATSLVTYPAPPEALAELVDPLVATGGHRARIVGVTRETPGAVTLTLRPGRGWPRHRPGQWVSLGVDVDGVRHHRCYSLTSVPDRRDRLVTVTVQEVPGGAVSGHLNRRARAGEVVQLGRPSGTFTREPADTRPALFVTGGSGLTPVIGMLRAAAAAGRPVDAVLLHHAPEPSRSLFTGELEELAGTLPGFRVVWTWTGGGPPPPSARLTARRLDLDSPDWRERTAWVCGPAPLLEAARAVWDRAGVAHRLHTEHFHPAITVPADAGDPRRITFTRTGRVTEADGATPLLEVAESAGLTPASGCRMGVCRTCAVPLAEGAVIDLRDGRVTDGTGALVQLCVNAARGDVGLDL